MINLSQYNRMSWANAKDSGVAYWPGAYGGQKLSITPTSNINIPQSTNQGPILSLKPNGNSVEIPIQSWYKYATLNGEMYFVDPQTGDVNRLQSEDNDLYWNNVLVATSDNISSIADWSLYPAISTVEFGYNLLKDVSTIFAQSGFYSTLNTSTLFGRSGTFSTISVSTLSGTNAQISTLSNVTMTTSKINTSSITASTVSLVSPDLTGTGVLTTALAGTELLWNGAAVRTASNTDDISQWSKYSILTGSNVSASGNNQSIFGNGNGSILLDSGGVIQANAEFAINFSNDRGASLLGPADINLHTEGGTFGRITLTADSGFSVDPLTDQGGLISLVANSAQTGTTPLALSRISLESATTTISAGALGALAFVPGSVNLLSGLGTGIQILTATGVINIASGQALTLSAAQAVAINGGANGVRFTNTSGSKLQTDFVNTYESNYTSIQAIDNSNMSQPTLTYLASTLNSAYYSTSVQNWAIWPAVSTVNLALNNMSNVNNLTANYLYSQGNIDAIGTVSAFSGTFSAINGPGPSLSIANTGYIALSTSNAVWINKLPSVGAVGDGDLRSGTLACSAGITAGGNISTSNAVVGSIGAFSQIDSVSTILFQGGASINRNGTDLTILNSISTQNFYSQVNVTTDGVVEANTVFADSYVSTNAVYAPFISTRQVNVSTINGFAPGSIGRVSATTPATIPTSTNNIVYEPINFNLENFDFLGSFTAPSTSIVLTQTGYYRFFGSCAFANNAQGQRNLGIFNATTNTLLDITSYAPTGNNHGQVTCDIEGTYLLGAGANIQLRCGQTSGSPLTLNSARFEYQRIR